MSGEQVLRVEMSYSIYAGQVMDVFSHLEEQAKTEHPVIFRLLINLWNTGAFEENVVLVSTEDLGRTSWEPKNLIFYFSGGASRAGSQVEVEEMTWWATSRAGNEATLCSSLLSRGLCWLLWFWPVGIRDSCDQHRVKHTITWCCFEPGGICRSALSGCEAITVVDLEGAWSFILLLSQKSSPFATYPVSKDVIVLCGLGQCP